MTCLSSIKYSMIATVLRVRDNGEVPNLEQTGQWQTFYDEATGEEKQVWVEADTSTVKPGVQTEVACLVTANYANRQDNDMTYSATKIIDTEYLTMKVPAKTHLYTTDRVTNILNNKAELIYEDDRNPNGVSAVYNVVGVSPVVDPFGRTVERVALLKKVNASG